MMSFSFASTSSNVQLKSLAVLAHFKSGCSNTTCIRCFTTVQTILRSPGSILLLLSVVGMLAPSAYCVYSRLQQAVLASSRCKFVLCCTWKSYITFNRPYACCSFMIFCALVLLQHTLSDVHVLLPLLLSTSATSIPSGS